MNIFFLHKYIMLILLFWYSIIGIFYYFFPVTPYYKSILCLIATILSSISIFFSYGHFTEKDLSFHHWSIDMTNTFMVSYLSIDLLFNYKRFDILIHHIFCLYMFINFIDNIMGTFVTFAEIISIWNCFPITEKYKRIFRLVSLFPIRTYIWSFLVYYKYFIDGYHPISDYSYIVACVMLLLDSYWVFLILKKI